MFWHSFKYSLKTTLRDRVQMFWSFIFIILLGTLFRATFGNAYEKSELRYNIEVVAYIEDEFIMENVSTIIENITVDEAGEKKLFDITYASSMEEAEELFDKSGAGLLYSEEGNLKLIVKESGIDESILSGVVSQYHQIITVMKDVADKPAEVQAAVMEQLMNEASKNVEKSISDANMDAFGQYFFNLITMGCLMAATAGVTFTIKNQANLSNLGARKNLGGAGTFARTFGGLAAIWLVLSIVTILAFGYLLIIGVDFGTRIPAVILTIIVGNLLGLSAGYFVGSIGKLSKSVKDSIAVLFSVFTCFLSGLMIMDMRMLIELNCPIINDINPAIWISDAFYSLVIYDTYDRYIQNMIIMTAFSLACLVG
ncbi:MAG: ABC transporter permease, partial [Lachnospiraceae bacterium]|nr:ABC transporter permease [Lachnospiraceae bacterium]